MSMERDYNFSNRVIHRKTQTLILTKRQFIILDAKEIRTQGILTATWLTYTIDGSQLDPHHLGHMIQTESGKVQRIREHWNERFHLDFADGSDLGDDNSGNNNDWTPQNLTGQTPVSYSSNGSITNNDGRTDQVGSLQQSLMAHNLQKAATPMVSNWTFDFTWILVQQYHILIKLKFGLVLPTALLP